ncbi:toxin YdaT family protein [Escherichia coli]
MKIKHEHIESVLLALAAEKGQAWVANAITEEYLRQGGGELPLVPGKDWNNQQNIYHRWLKGETKTQREKIQKLIPAILAILPRELRHRLCIFDTLERRALLAAQEALSTTIDAHDDAVQAVYRKAYFSDGGSSGESVVVH